MNKNKSFRKSGVWAEQIIAFFSSLRLTACLLTILIPVIILSTFIPQGLSSQEYVTKFGWNVFRIIYYLHLSELFRSPWFLILLFLLGINILACTVSRLVERKSHFGFILTHLSLLALILGGFLSAQGRIRGELVLHEGQTANSFEVNGKQLPLGFDLKLNKFELQHYDDSGDKLTINVPGYDRPYEFLIREQIWMPIPGTPYQFRVEQYVPDFRFDSKTHEFFSASDEPNNPAIYVHVTGDSKDYGEWVFAKFPDFHMHQEGFMKLRYRSDPAVAKDFRSNVEVLKDGQVVKATAIRVNHPLRYGGYLIYQATYDSHEQKWTGLGVSRDPGTPFVYGGIIGLMLGLTYNIYLRPWRKKSKKSITSD